MKFPHDVITALGQQKETRCITMTLKTLWLYGVKSTRMYCIHHVIELELVLLVVQVYKIKIIRYFFYQLIIM